MNEEDIPSELDKVYDRGTLALMRGSLRFLLLSWCSKYGPCLKHEIIKKLIKEAQFLLSSSKFF